MSLVSTLRRPALNSAFASAFGALGTLVLVWLAGPAVFANYTVDLARLSLVSLILEAVPSAYAIYHIQRDPEFRAALRAFSGVGAIAITLVTLFLAAAGAFSYFSPWVLAYVAYLPAQRYVDISLQADGRVERYFFLLMAVNAFRLLLLIAGLTLWPGPGSDIAWASIAIASWASIAAIYAIDSSLRAAVSLPSGERPLQLLWSARRSFYGYYLNAVLKRIKDSLMMLICGSLVTSPIVIAQYALVFRGLDFVCGQFRLAESALANYENRRHIARSRSRDLVVLSVLGQGVAIALGAVLALQAGPLDRSILVAIGFASFAIYPYVVELTLRSDAYAAFRPRRVTLSIAAYIAIAAAIAFAWLPFGLNLTALVVVHVAAQLGAAVPYLLVAARRPVTNLLHPPKAKHDGE